MPTANVICVGAGIVGLATAYRLTERCPDLAVRVLEKEEKPAQHQSGRNSGVLHSGIYYQPGSKKALNCRIGKSEMEAFCREHEIPVRIDGKVIVATEEWELPELERLLARGRENGVLCEPIDGDRLRELEPHAAGIRAIHVPETGVVDYRVVCDRLREIVKARGGKITTNARVIGIRALRNEVVIETTAGEFTATLGINCAGLHSDRIAALAGAKPTARIVPFRGEYYALRNDAPEFCRALIYPVPDPNFPFLGVHFTRRINHSVECGPNAVLALAREGYDKSTINWRDFAETLGYSGFRRLVGRHWRRGAGEVWRSFRKGAFVTALQRLIPELRPEHLEPAKAGVRAQALTPDGKLVDDFLIVESERFLHVLNAPSPAATASLQIGGDLADRVLRRLAAAG